ncbi:hypothetical protein V6N13_079315 [Hibiscus sabdariffa]
MVVVYSDRFLKVFELKNVHMSVRRFLFDIGATLDAVNSVYFQPMGGAIISGRNMSFMPPCNDLKGWILKKSMEMVKSDDEKLITSCVRISCYNLANRWNIQPCRILLYFLVYCAKGVLSKSIYASTVINSSDDLYEILKQVVEEVRFKLGLQVITNCDEQCTRRRLAETFPALHWTLHAAHCIGLILEDFVKVEWINTIIEQARFMTRFIYKHGVVLNMVRMYAFDNDTGELAAAQSTTNFTTLTHMVDLRNNLQPMVTSHEWTDFPYLQKSRGRKFFFSSSVEKHGDHNSNRAREEPKLMNRFLQRSELHIFVSHFGQLLWKPPALPDAFFAGRISTLNRFNLHKISSHPDSIYCKQTLHVMSQRGGEPQRGAGSQGAQWLHQFRALPEEEDARTRFSSLLQGKNLKEHVIG